MVSLSVTRVGDFLHFRLPFLFAPDKFAELVQLQLVPTYLECVKKSRRPPREYNLLRMGKYHYMADLLFNWFLIWPNK